MARPTIAIIGAGFGGTQLAPDLLRGNVAGPGCGHDRIGHPLVRGLPRSRLARPDPLRLGLEVTATRALRDARGVISRRLFTVVPAAKEAFWEMTPVPDIRRPWPASPRTLTEPGHKFALRSRVI